MTACSDCPLRYRPKPRPVSVYEVQCASCGTRYEPHEAVSYCPKCGVQIVISGWGGKK